jgi:RNA polymerase sigma-70 factor (family 1)
MNAGAGNNDQLYVKKLKEHNVPAFDSLFNKYSNKLYRFSFSLLKNAEDAEEIVQETFYRVWKRRGQIDITKSFKAYLFTISHNLIIDRLREKLKEKEYRESLLENFEETEPEKINEQDFVQLTEAIRVAVEELPSKRKEIYKLSREQGLSNREIARKFGITVKTVENQINLSLKHLKNRLGKQALMVSFFLALFG